MSDRRSHWSWQPLLTPQPPITGHPIDAFVRSQLRSVGLTASPAAKSHEQLRRLWIDLVGLPPTLEAIERFGDTPSDADYEREVDILLASQHFGERWARHWLDLMRYSETLGHEFDYELPNAWRYRDYVVRAFNDDVPYDQFLREHIAGDLLATPRRGPSGNDESIQATASWWFVEQTHSPVDAKQHQADRIDNQIDVFGKAFLGLTIACARCHDHKFDAIPTKDYYSLFGFVRSSRYVQAPISPISCGSNTYQRALSRHKEFMSAWLPDAQPTKTDITWRPEDIIIANTKNPQSRWYITNDGFGNRPWEGPFCANPEAEHPEYQQLPGPFWLSAAAGARREGSIATETFSLKHRYVHARLAGNHSRAKLIVDGFHIVRDPIYGSLHRNIDNKNAHWVTIDVQMWLGSKAHLIAIDQRAPDLGDPRHNRGEWPEDSWIAIQSVINSPHAAPPATTDLTEDPKKVLTGNQAEWILTKDGLLEAINAMPVSPTLPAMADGNGVDSPVYLRGDHNRVGEQAERRFLTALADASSTKAPQDSSGRLQLADAVLDKNNPLPSRVIVNRLWHHLFGRGIVESVDNFGALGATPTHPKLLDWLAGDLIGSGWSIKHSIRQIVTSQTYRQSSRQRPDTQEKDPQNNLIHRQNVRPLSAESLRDCLLAVSDRLSKEAFGPSIEQPESAITDARGAPKNHGPLDGNGRRSIYLAIRRNFMSNLMLVFDLPTPFATVGKRNKSNVPAQSLALSNAPIAHELSKSFAERIMAISEDDHERIETAYLIAFGRTPRQLERDAILAFVNADADASESQNKATWAAAMHALINTTEFRFYR